MMLHPSYNDLMNVANSNVEEGEQPVVNSRYSIVIATSKRARQIIEENGLPNGNQIKEGDKPLSVAIDEFCKNEVRIVDEDDSLND